jgi:hypothetical protein
MHIANLGIIFKGNEIPDAAEITDYVINIRIKLCDDIVKEAKLLGISFGD